MASHDVALKVATELPVGAVDLEIPVKRNGRKIGTFTVNANGVSWNPATAKAATSVSWEELPAALSGTPAAAPAPAAPAAKKAAPAKAAPAAKTAPAKAAPAAKKAAPAKKSTAKKATPAPVAEPAVETPAPAAAPTPAPAAAPAAKKSTAKKSTAKKAAPSAAAVDARAVRTWAAEKGITVAPRGPISSSIIDQFRAATA